MIASRHIARLEGNMGPAMNHHVAHVATQQEQALMSITERLCSAISLIGSFVIVTTFLWSPSFRKPINRLVFYASWGNIMLNIATMISQSGIQAGGVSPLCQFQAFLIHWFLPADALWTLAMALNVYLTFFYRYDSKQLRQLEWKYAVGCYGLPFIPAFIYFFIHTPTRGRVYGPAVIWCSVTMPWDFLRVAVLFGPVWFAIFLTFAIYLRAGLVIYQQRRELRALGSVDSHDSHYPLDNHAGIQVTREIDCSTPQRPSAVSDIDIPVTARSLTSSTFSTIRGGITASTDQNSEEQPQSIQPSSSRCESSLLRPGLSQKQSQKQSQKKSQKSSQSEVVETYPQQRMITKSRLDAWAYTKYAMLFFIALLVTW
ncbi:hypothetical protein N7486_002095, partial [Penicillium sp. IBT 16267x]